MTRSDFTPAELDRLRVAVQLRAEAAEDNEDQRESREWRRLLNKVQKLKDRP